MYLQHINNAYELHTLLFFLLCLCYMLPFLQAVCMSVVSISISKEFSLTSHDISLLGSAYLYGYAVIQFLAGIIVSKLGARFTPGIFLCLSALGCILLSVSSNWASITASRAICGMGVAVVLTSALAIFIQWFRPEYFGRLCSWYFCFGGLGAVWGTAPWLC